MILEISKIIAIAYFFYSAESIIQVIKVNKFNPLKYINTIVSCNKCFAFWGGLFVTGNVDSALLISLCVLLMESFIVTKL